MNGSPRPRAPLATYAGAAVLATWAIAFWFLSVSGARDLYLSTRTAWVVPVGATILTVAAVGRAVAARRAGAGAAAHVPRAREAWMMAAVVAPAVLLLALPPTTLGQFSAARRADVAVGASGIGGIGSGELTIVDVAVGQTSTEGERALARRAGETVTFLGVVTRYGDTPADEFLLTRYVVTCCVADATVAQVRVVDVPIGAFASDAWVEVTGIVYPVGREVIVVATSVRAVPRPDRPYVTP